MGAQELMILVVTLVSIAVAMVAVVVPLAVTAIVMFIVFKRLMSGGGVLVVGPSVQLGGLAAARLASAAVAAPQRPPEADYVKRSQCPACASPKVQRSLSAYVYCDYCAELMDWDFQACLADKRSKVPGPTYVALVRRLQPQLDKAKRAGDQRQYLELQRQIFRAYAEACPAALSPRIGDPRYRDAFVEYTAASQTAADFDEACDQAFQEQQAKTAALKWDRSNPLAPRVDPATFWPLLEAVGHNQRLRAEIAERSGLLQTHPDRPSVPLMMKIGVSAMVQGWMPYLTDADRERLLDQTGLRDKYTRVEPFDATEGVCPSCSAPVTAVAGASRVVCYACGHMVGTGGGTLACHGCAAKVEIPAGTALFECPHCDAELRLMRHV